MSRHTHISHISHVRQMCERFDVTAHARHVTRIHTYMIESCHTYEDVTLQISDTFDTSGGCASGSTSRHTHVMSHAYHTYMIGSCHTYEDVT